jgi:hypothetical protein
MEELKDKIQQEFNIPDWDSEEGKEKRNEVANAAKNAITNITDAVKSSLTNREKARKVQSYLKGISWMSAVGGVWSFLAGTTLNKPEFSFRTFDVDLSHVVELGPTFWIKVALILFTLRIIHKIVSTGGIIIKDMMGLWKFIKNLFKEKVVKESFFTIEEYKYLKLFE